MSNDFDEVLKECKEIERRQFNLYYCGGPGLTDSWRGRDNGSPHRSLR